MSILKASSAYLLKWGIPLASSLLLTAKARRTLIVVAQTLVVFGVLMAEEKITFVPSTGSIVQVSGTSTLHKWQVSTSSPGGQLMLGGQGADITKLLVQTPLSVSAIVQIPVSTIKSGESGMDEKMYEALRAKTNPMITYRLTRGVFSGRKGNLFLFDTDGVLNVGGTDRSIKMPVEVAYSLEKGTITVQGSLPMKMTDVSIPPPTAMLGAIRSGDDVVVTFTWVLKRQ